MDAIVIGAGHAGLAVSQQLGQLELDHLVLERGRIGESWRSQRWASFPSRRIFFSGDRKQLNPACFAIGSTS